jgi:hypothetical protein
MRLDHFASRAALVVLLALVGHCARAVTPLYDGAATDTPTPPADTGSTLACNAATDCGWTEIPHEIVTRTDCPCLFGCPMLIVNRATAARRMAQYNMLCTPGVDGMGRMCGVDDCAGPPMPVCRNGMCAAP